MFLRLVVPLLLFAAFYVFASWVQARAERRAEHPQNDAERAAGPPEDEPPQEMLRAA